MATILNLTEHRVSIRPKQERVRKPSGEGAQIIIFPGVRYERQIPDTTNSLAKNK